METIRNPNPDHGCLGKALADEPMFILLARDPSAPAAIRRWAKSRRKFRPDEEAQTAQAEQDADEFAAWREAHLDEWKDPDAPRLQIIIPTDQISSLAGRVMGQPALDDKQIGDLIKAVKTAKTTDDEIVAIKTALEPVEQAARRLAGFVLNADPVAGPNG